MPASSTMLKNCPAFEGGCCFAEILDPKLNECTVFYTGCPFKDASSEDDVKDILGRMLASSAHAADGSGANSDRMSALINEMHKTTVDVKEKLGACPVFNSGCPFKAEKFMDSVKHVLEVKNALKAEQKQLELAKQQKQQRKGSDALPHPQFSVYLRESTEPLHEAATRHPFIKSFVAKKISLTQYKEYMKDLYFLYTELESAVDKLAPTNQYLNKIHFPETLPRAAKFRRDLEFLYGSSKAVDALKPSRTMELYVDRVRQVSKEQPDLLVAHHYIRYIGDLSGAQMLGRIARQAFDWTDERHATSFVEFPDLPQNKDKRAFKDRYRKILDELPLSAQLQDEIVEEVNKAYNLNTDFFTELESVPSDSGNAVASKSSGAFPKSVIGLTAAAVVGAVSLVIFALRARAASKTRESHTRFP